MGQCSEATTTTHQQIVDVEHILPAHVLAGLDVVLHHVGGGAVCEVFQ